MTDMLLDFSDVLQVLLDCEVNGTESEFNQLWFSPSF